MARSKFHEYLITGFWLIAVIVSVFFIVMGLYLTLVNLNFYEGYLSALILFSGIYGLRKTWKWTLKNTDFLDGSWLDSEE